ncbi:MAG: cytochrome C oxidase subunit II [Acidobacteria bacterium]|nr:cytochrome C oxidase subunit II [Acidobacteriota bacterium]
MISWLLPQASTFASTIDGLVLLIAVIVGFWLIVAEVVLFGFIFKFRARDGIRGQYVSGEDKSQKQWVSYPHYAVVVFDIIIIAAALRVWNEVKVEVPPADEQIRIIAQQWSWTFVHAGPDGKLDTRDDIRTVDDMYVQRDRVYTFELHARDVVHSFSVPAFRLKQDAVPGRAIRGWFKPTLEGTFDIQCAEMCGMGHGLMAGRVHIGSAAQYAAWMTNLTKIGAAGTAMAPTLMADVAAHDHAGTAGGTR